MTTWSKKETQWRNEFRAAIAEAGLAEEFKAKVADLTLELMKLHKDRKFCDKLANKRVAEQYTHIFDPVAFNARWNAMEDARKLEKAQANPQAAISHEERGRRAQKKKKKDKFDTRVLDAKLDNDAADYRSSDILSDTKWVYANMARLIRVVNGQQALNKSVLKEAPSAGAVGLAGYALEDPKAFFEKFVTKILPKDEEKPKGQTDEEKLKELDPTFDDLVKYMKRLEDLPVPQGATTEGEKQEEDS